jgi:hypothetical protein
VVVLLHKANRNRFYGLVALAPLLALSSIQAVAGTIDFEGLPDSTIVTTQYPGLTFTNAVILTAGISLNEFEFPPHSGTNVVSDNGGFMTIAFSAPVTSVSGYFTYLEPVTLTAFDSGSSQLGQTFSAFNSNLALSGDPGSSPNELLALNFPTGISSLSIAGDPAGGSFVLDDLTYSSIPTQTPEPSAVSLLLTGAGLMLRVKLNRPS